MFHPILAPSLLLLAIDLQILPTFCSDSSNLMDDELHTSAQQHNPTKKLYNLLLSLQLSRLQGVRVLEGFRVIASG
jgi:hypothetical protein